MDARRLVETLIPLERISVDSLAEKMNHVGHIKSFHSWPARRPLAACRAIIAATLLFDPEDAPDNLRQKYTELSGTSDIKRQREYLGELISNVTQFGTENSDSIVVLRDLIQRTYQQRPPRLADFFAGGGSIPLEGMRLGCEVIAVEYNPVAWFILKCTLDYAFRSIARKQKKKHNTDKFKPLFETHQDFLSQIRYWANWVYEKASAEALRYYPETEGKYPCAYLWTRTVPCKDRGVVHGCGGIVPLLNTKVVSTKSNYKREINYIVDNEKKSLEFEIIEPNSEKTVQKTNGKKGKKKRIECPFCAIELKKDYIKFCGIPDKQGIKQMSEQLVCSIFELDSGKEFRNITEIDMAYYNEISAQLEKISTEIPFGMLNEKLPPSDTSGAGRALTAPQYGFVQWKDFYNKRQLFNLFLLIKYINSSKVEMKKLSYEQSQIEAIASFLSCILDKIADYNCSFTKWQPKGLKGNNLYSQWVIPIIWDYVENNPWGDGSATWKNTLDWILEPIERGLMNDFNPNPPQIIFNSATNAEFEDLDLVVTDPPYYDAIPYADLSDFFYVLLRRTVGDLFPEQFQTELTPKMDEIVQYSNRCGGDLNAAKDFYEKRMTLTFENIFKSLKDNGRFVVAFAHKDPQAWETLASSIINTGFIVTASWPIKTEMGNRSRSQESAALATSVWLVCKKVVAKSGVGRFSEIKKEMQKNIVEKLRYFWDSRITGADFVWSAIGPALEIYSRYTDIRRIDGSVYTIPEFLKDVRNTVIKFALGRILNGKATDVLDEWSLYYLMHRFQFGMLGAPVGECILLSQAFMIELNDLSGKRGLLVSDTNREILRLRRYEERKDDNLGTPNSWGTLPYIDLLHKLLQLWEEGNTEILDTFVMENNLSNNEIFWTFTQSVLEMAEDKSQERYYLEAIVKAEGPSTSKIPTLDKYRKKQNGENE